MKIHPQSISFFSLVVILLLLAAIQPAVLEAQSCSGTSPGRYVPGPPPDHDPAAPDVDLWLTDVFRPGRTGYANRQLPPERDSTGWDSLTVPGFDSGNEIFESLDVAGDYIYVAYNAGFSIWDVGGATHGERPSRVKVRDGWNFPGAACRSDPNCGPFLSFPSAGEIDFLIEDISVLPDGASSNVYIAVSGRAPVGISLWLFDTVSRDLSPIYQDTTQTTRQVRLVEDGGRVYAFASSDNGLPVYDLTRALVIDPCLEETGSDCPGVYLGNLGSITTGRYLDVLQRPTGGLLVSASNGDLGSQGLDLWEVTDPSNPGSANQLFSGLDNRTFGSALFTYEGNDYLAALERVGALNVIKIFNINACRGSCSLGTPVFDDVGVPPRISNQFLTYSVSNNTPFLYYGLFGGFGGAQVEQLLNLTTLGRPGQNITEMTTGGPTYFDTCVNMNLDYWAWYYPGNEFGLKNFSPRVGKFDADSNFFYRAAGGVLDVHVWEAGAVQDPMIAVSVSSPDPQGLYWMADEVTFEGAGSNGCNPAGIWTWTPSTPAEINAVTVSEIGNQVTYRFECNSGGGRCADAAVSVSGVNSDPTCAGAVVTPAGITVKDPGLEIVSITPASGTFTQCEVVTFAAELLGRGPVDFAWRVNGVEEQVGVAPEEELSKSTLSFDWDTATVAFDEIFSDGFESGDISRWGGEIGRGRTLAVTIELELDGGTAFDAVNVDLDPLTGDPEFGDPAIISSTLDNSTFDFHANTVAGTVSEWAWELEDDDGGSLCTFGVDADVPCVVTTGQDVNHTWFLQAGERRVEVTGSNCQSPTAAEASTSVTVVSTVPLEVTNFELDRAQSSSACDIDATCLFDFICTCHVNQTVFFEVIATGNPSFYDFDWDGNGTFEDVNNPATGTQFTKTYPTVLGQVMPVVKARRGAATPAQKDLRETLDIQP